MVESWRAIPDFEGLYEASDRGRVRSLDRVRCDGRRVSGRVLSPGRLSNGYLQVTLRKDNVSHQWKVHRAVAAAFHGVRPPNSVIRHLDGDVSNNLPENLIYGTSSENQQDSVRHGTHKEIRKTHCAHGHPLCEPNLRVYRHEYRKSHRECLSCHQARWMIRSRPELSFQVVADACLAQLMYGAVNPYRRSKSEAHLQNVREGSHFQSRKTHCPVGHPLAEDNLDSNALKHGGRKCRECANARKRVGS